MYLKLSQKTQVTIYLSNHSQLDKNLVKKKKFNFILLHLSLQPVKHITKLRYKIDIFNSESEIWKIETPKFNYIKIGGAKQDRVCWMLKSNT
jgi:hypothetical protein